jgi:glutaminyl-peptide cyclotransferase
MKYKQIITYLFLTIFTLFGSACSHNRFVNDMIFLTPPIANKKNFNSLTTMKYIEKQIAFGPRIPGSSGSIATQEFILNEMEQSGWMVESQDFEYNGIHSTNIIAKSSPNPPRLILGTHYDSRACSDNESSFTLQLTPVPGANDGASGTAVLLELGNILDISKRDIWLVYFDSEDQGRLNGWEWSLGAQYFVDNLDFVPDDVIIIDMIGDKNLEIYKEINSDPTLTNSIWEEAAHLGFESVFIPEEKYSIYDDHIPFINREISATLIIDIEYPFWHTTEDTFLKVSQESIDIVGNVLLSWINKQNY